MGLLERAIVAAVVIVLVVAGVIFIYGKSAQAAPLTESQAVQIVGSDIRAGNPAANITLISVSNSSTEKDSWNVVYSVAYNVTRPCPTLQIEGFDYPATGLVPSIDNLYTQNCTIYGISDAPTYVISSPEIAIVRSYTIHNATIDNYVSDYGYNNTRVYARFYQNLPANETPNGTNMSAVWVVRYSASGASSFEYAVMGQAGNALLAVFSSTSNAIAV